MAQANAQNTLFGGVAADNGRHQPCLGRNAGAGRKQHRIVSSHGFERQPVVTKHSSVTAVAEVAQQLHQIVGEGVVIIEDEEFHFF